MNTKTVIAAIVAALSVTITMAGCGGSSSGEASSTAQDTTTTTVAPTTIAQRTTAQDSSNTTTTAAPTTITPTTTTTTTTTTVSPTTVVRPTTLVDELVPVHGARLHVHCDGSGPTTVVLIAGFNTGSDIWAAIEPTVAQTTRVCSYDRFGNGASDAPPAAQTFATQAADLHALLESAGEPGPYVIVGHSFGGPEAVTFASMFPTEVRGLLLLDASPPTWNAAICAVPDDGSDTAHVFQALCEQQSSPANNAERLDAPAAFAEVAAIGSLSGFPMIVATADHHSYAGLASSEEARLNDVWNAGQAHWVSLGSSAQLVTVDNTSHNIQLDRPDVVLDKIHELLQ
jgi:pimeloyl-ACP methyl ester carboxylesterase